MLVLTRKSEESVIIGNNIEVKVLAVRGDQVSIGFNAPDEISIYRKEVYDAIQKENLQAVQSATQDISWLQDKLSNVFNQMNANK
jgi:carbon storage regulator